MGRILALDIGSSRIGLAITDENQIICQPMPYTVKPAELIGTLESLNSDYGIEKIIVGLPKSLSGEEGMQAKKTREQGDMIQKSLNIPIEYFDERLTSKEAIRLSQSGSTLPIDSLAAQQILQDYLKPKNVSISTR